MMSERKKVIKLAMLALIKGECEVTYKPVCKGSLFNGIAEIMVETGDGSYADYPKAYPDPPRDPKLTEEDRSIAEELFWDLFIERKITMERPFEHNPLFVIHSEWDFRQRKQQG